MNLPLFIAKRIYRSQDGRQEVSRPAVRIAIIGVAIGLAVMIITVSVVLGFKHTIRDKVTGFGGHLQVQNMLSFSESDPYSICADDSLMQVLAHIPGVAHAERYAYTQGLLKTDDDFLGVILKGVAQEFDTTFISQHLLAGEFPEFSDSVGSQKLVVSRMIADKLRLEVGQKVFAYFIEEDNVRTRRFTISGIYQTNMTRFDESLCFTDLHTASRLNGWGQGYCSGVEMSLESLDRLNEAEETLISEVNRSDDNHGNVLMSRSIFSLYPNIFTWLELLDINVWIILCLMIAVAGFTMISGLLIIILERTQMIGVLKAIGARNGLIRRTFLWFSVFIILQGMLWGNLLGIGIVLLQQTTHLIALDPQVYYVSEAPMELNLPLIMLINAATLLICVFVLIAPSYLISHIHPARSMRYE